MTERDDGEVAHRKGAPGQPSDHPDWVLSLSGGINSTAAALVALDAIETRQADGNFAKKPFAVYLDTRVGVPLNRLYVEQLCDWLGVQLWTLRTDESFLDWLRSEGAPGGGAHNNVRRKLKDRQVSRLTTALDEPMYVLGLSAYESEHRASLPKINEKDDHTEVYPVHRLSRKEQVEIILRSGCPIHPLWAFPAVIQDCGCLSNGDPSELKRTAELFPKFAQRLEEWEESIEHEGLKGTLGWDGLTAAEKSAKRDGYDQTTLTTCGVGGCTRERDPDVVQAFKAAAHGATEQESIDILYGASATDVQEVTAGVSK